MFVEVVEGRVVVNPGLAGGAGPIVGRTMDSELEWVAAKESPGRAFVDWQAPIGEAFIYTHGEVTSDVVMVESYRRDELASLDVRTVAPISRSDSRERALDRDVHEFWPKGGARPYTLRGGPNRYSEPVVFMADAEASLIVEALLEDAYLVVRHNRALCRVRRCSVPAVRLFSTRSGSATFLGQDYSGEVNEWVLEGVEPRPPAVPVPARTWADISRGYSSWADVSAAHSSWSGVRDGR